MKPLVIGITGTLLAGKGTIVDMLKDRGFTHISVRELIKDELQRLGLEPTRKNMQDMGNNMRKKHPAFWMRRALEGNFSGPVIIESLRNPSEIDYLRENSRFYLLGVDAPFELRWERLKNRNIDKDKSDYDDFVNADARDRGMGEPITGQQVGMCLAQADFLIYNDENSKDKDSKLYKHVMEICDEVLKEKQ